MIRLFDIKGGVIIPTEHCYVLEPLKKIMDKYKDYTLVYAYIFYMSCPNPDLNPFFNVAEHERKEKILSSLGDVSFNVNDLDIEEALEFVKDLYSTPMLRAYEGVKSALDKLALYLKTMEVRDGKDSNISNIVNIIKTLDSTREAFKNAELDLLEEQKSVVRGNQFVSYDQKDML